MVNVTQVAFQLDNESLRRIDELADAESSSRAQILRSAVHQLLTVQRERAIDAQLAAGYAAAPQRAEDVGWASASLDGLQAAELDW